MLTLLGTPRRLCDGWTRRETLRAGALTLVGGLTLPELLHRETQARSRSVYLYLGIDPDLPVVDRGGRPIPIAQGGQPIHEILT